MQHNNTLKVNVLLLEDIDSKAKSKKIPIDFSSIQSIEGTNNSLLALLSKEYQIDINTKTYDIEVLYMSKWITIIDVNSFAFFISSNIITEDQPILKLTYKGTNSNTNSNALKYEDEDMIEANELDMSIYKDKKTIVKCGICHQSSNNDFFIHRLGPFYGPFKHCDQKYYIHLICALWCPQVCISKSNRLINVAKEIHRSKREKCSYCGDTGAALGCWLISKDICKKKYHYLCAISEGCVLNKKAYGVLCPKHKKDHVIPDPEDEGDEKGDGVRNYKKSEGTRKGKGKDDGSEIEEEAIVCSICVLSCDQDYILKCIKCNRYVHWYCDDHKVIIDDDEEENISNKDYVCSKCKKEIQFNNNNNNNNG